MGWNRYLHGEASVAGCEIMDTTALPIVQSIRKVLSYLKD